MMIMLPSFHCYKISVQLSILLLLITACFNEKPRIPVIEPPNHAITQDIVPLTELPPLTVGLPFIMMFPKFLDNGEFLLFSMAQYAGPDYPHYHWAPTIMNLETKEIEILSTSEAALNPHINKNRTHLIYNNELIPKDIILLDLITKERKVIVGRESNLSRDVFHDNVTATFNPNNDNEVLFWSRNMADNFNRVRDRGIAIYYIDADTATYLVNRMGPTMPSWSFDGNAIFYTDAHQDKNHFKDIFEINLSNKLVRQITKFEFQQTSTLKAKTSPDGNTLAIVLKHPEFESNTLALIDYDGTNLRYVTNFIRPIADHIWHPNSNDLLLQITLTTGDAFFIYNIEQHSIKPFFE